MKEPTPEPHGGSFHNSTDCPQCNPPVDPPDQRLTVAIDVLEDKMSALYPDQQREHLPDCPVDGAYGCPGTCPCWCHPPAVPPGAYLSREEWERVAPDSSKLTIDAATEKGYRKGYKDGINAAKVLEQGQQD